MRVAVFSDTHGKLTGLAHVRELLGPVDLLLHAGDHFADAPKVAVGLGLTAAQVQAVIGNCDLGQRGPEDTVLNLGGVRILLTHGHRYDVKHTLQRVFYRAEEAGARVAIFGHSHVPVNVNERGVLLFNPGSYSEPRTAGPPTCGLLTIEEQKVRVEHIPVGPGF